MFVTFTPLLGMSTVVKRFLLEKNEDRNVTTMTIDDVDWPLTRRPSANRSSTATPSMKTREARSKGIPTLGSGRISSGGRGPDQLSAIPLPQVLEAHWGDGFRLGSSLNGGSLAHMGRRHRHRLCA